VPTGFLYARGVTPVLASAELRAASERFARFFEELGRVFVEREDVVSQIALALLSREHVLMTGPPGTAKSGIAAAVLGRIIDERTGAPSVFARQFTESTVQTDLVGPIDFKTLMQTGRTEHFTDEGMLGAVHAFLDEVLDGRDMLLRSTLNVLHERELKQGTKTTTGRIECALMTTNRYLAEVLEGSRETLLAFVDRVAFVGFVPKGFADPESLGKVLRSQVGGARPRALKAVLTIQDLDVLQAAADRVLVPDEVCAALGMLLEHMDADLAAAAKNDPTFQATRYLSTRTAVRLARILRAVCVHDIVVNGAKRDLEVETKDLEMLRLSLLLSGPSSDAVGKLLEKESDPRERRQLSILRTERDIFERAFARVPKPKGRVPKRPAPQVSVLADEVKSSLKKDDPKPLLAVAAKLAQAADAGAPEAAELLGSTLANLAERAVRVGSTAGAGPETAVLDVVPELASLADGLERASGSARPVARWLRGRAIHILLDAASLSGANVGDALDAELPAEPSMTAIVAQAERALKGLEDILQTIARLRAAGAEEPEGQAFDRAIGLAVSRVEDELLEIWDTGFRDTVASALARVGGEQLGPLVAALAPALDQIDAFGARLATLGGKATSLKARVVGPRIEPLVRAAFDRIEGRDRLELVEQVAKLVMQLDKGGLKAVVPPATLLRFAVSALVRTEKKAPSAATRDHAGYRALRGAEHRVSLSYTVVELALRVTPERPSATATPSEIVHAIGGLVGALPDTVRAQVIELDARRMERAITLLEEWWASLARGAEAAARSADVGKIGRELAALGDSKFFHVTRDEGALLRFALEARVGGELFPESQERMTTVRSRIDALEADSSRVINALRRDRADAGWTELLGPTSKRGS
jgi:MoxR-like ATPase